MIKQHRRKGDRFQGMDLLYLTTVGAKTGHKRQNPVSRFPDGEDAWLVVASSGGSAHHPAWYHNIAAHPDQVWAEVTGRQYRVTAEQLTGSRWDEAWQRIIAEQPRYAGYQRKTDRALPDTARIITSAAVIMVAVFLSFAVAKDPSTKMFGKETAQILRAAVHELPDHQQRLLAAFTNTSGPDRYHQVSTALNIPVGSIGPTRSRALRNLRNNPRLRPALYDDE
jgi:deazaflavin-dependent oxidoreductase (nitroreductase family)